MSKLLSDYYRTGHSVWIRTRGDGSEAVRVTNSHRDQHDLSARANLLTAHQWVDGACRTIVATEDYFTAMACTSIVADDSALRIPWPTFAVAWPGTSVESNGIIFNAAIVSALPAGNGSAMVLLGAGAFVASIQSRMNIADMLFEPATRGDAAPCAEVVRRAIVGLLYTMDHTNNWSVSRLPSPISRGKLRESPPPHRVIIVGRPLNYSMAPAVRAECKGEGAAPSVQTLVRGHRKRQVCGAGRVGRRVIWVEPYWRGPENAPILARPYVVQ